MCILTIDVLLFKMHLAVQDKLSSEYSMETTQMVMELRTAQSIFCCATKAMANILARKCALTLHAKFA